MVKFIIYGAASQCKHFLKEKKKRKNSSRNFFDGSSMETHEQGKVILLDLVKEYVIILNLIFIFNGISKEFSGEEKFENKIKSKTQEKTWFPGKKQLQVRESHIKPQT